MKAFITAAILAFSANAFATTAKWEQNGGSPGQVEFIEFERVLTFCKDASTATCEMVDPSVLSIEEQSQTVLRAIEINNPYNDVDLYLGSLEEALAEAFPAAAGVEEFLNEIDGAATVVRIHMVLEDEYQLKDWWDVFEIYDHQTGLIYRTKAFNFGQN